jgi:Flp pilus assembly protein TadB
MKEKIIQYFESIWLANPILAYLQIALAIVFIISAFFFVSYLFNHHWFSMKFAKLQANIDKQRKIREEEYKQRYLLEGETEQEGVLSKVDSLILDAGLKDRYPELNAENFIFLIVGITVILSTIIGFWMHNSLIGFVNFCVILAFTFIYLEVKAIKNYINIENQLLKFMNALDNMSSLENTIGEMLGRTVPYLSEPLRVPVEQCYYEIKSGVPVDESLKRLSTKVNHKKFRAIINSLRICAMHNENYAEVIEENKTDVKEYVSFKRQMRNIRKNFLGEIGILAVAGCGIMYVLSMIVEDIWNSIFGTIVGRAILVYLGVVILVGIISTIRKDRK